MDREKEFSRHSLKYLNIGTEWSPLSRKLASQAGRSRVRVRDIPQLEIMENVIIYMTIGPQKGLQ